MKKKGTMLILAVLLFVMSCVPVMADTETGTYTLADGLYTISVSLGGRTRVLDVAAGSTEAKANIQAYDSNGSTAQKFYVTNVGGHTYKITNLKSGLVLDAAGGQKTNKTNVQQYPWNGSAAQQWEITSADGKTWQVIGTGSGLSLDVAAGSPANGANVDLYTYNGTAAQRWSFAATKVSLSGASVSVRPQVYTGLAVKPAVTVKCGGVLLKEGTNYIKSFSGNEGAGMGTVTITGMGIYTGTKSASFKIYASAATAEAGGSYLLISKMNTALALDVKAGAITPGSNIRLYRINESEAQIFTAVTGTDGSFQLENEKSSLMMDAVDEAKDAANVETAEDGKATQQWKLQANTDGTVTFVNAVSGNCLDLEGGNAYSGANVCVRTPSEASSQKFYLVKTDAAEKTYAGTYTLQLSAGDGTAVLDIAGGSTKSLANVQIYKANGSDAQKFRILYSGDGCYRIVNVKSGKVLEAAGGKTANGTNVRQNDFTGAGAQLWKIAGNGDGTVTISAKLKNTAVLDAAGGKTVSGTNVQLYQTNGSAAQKWILGKE